MIISSLWRLPVSASRPVTIRSNWTWPTASLTKRYVSQGPMRRGYSEGEDKIVIEHRAQGVPYNVIASQLGRSTSSVVHRFNKYLIPKSPERKLWTPDEDAIIVQKRAAGCTYKDIAATISRNEVSVRRRHREVLVPSSTAASTGSPLRPDRPRPFSSPRPDMDELILKGVDQGKTWHEIGDEIGRHFKTARLRALRLRPELRCTRSAPPTKGEIAALRHLAMQGLSCLEIATQMGWPRHRAYHYTEKHNIPRNRRIKSAFTVEEIQRMLDLHASRYTRFQIAQMLGRRLSTVSRKLNRLLPRRAPASSLGAWSDAEAMKAVELCSQGKTVRQVAMQLRRGMADVKHILGQKAPNMRVRTAAKSRKWTEEEKTRLTDLYQQQLSWQEIADQFPERRRGGLQSFFYNKLVDRISEPEEKSAAV